MDQTKNYVDINSFKSGKIRIIENEMTKLYNNIPLQKLIYIQTGGKEQWYEDIDEKNKNLLITIKNENLKHIETIKDSNFIEDYRIHNAMKIHSSDYKQIEELERNAIYLAQHMHKNYINFEKDLKEIVHQKDLTSIKFSKYYNLHQHLITFCTFLNIIIAFMSSVGSILEITEKQWYMFFSPSIAVINSIISLLINHWNLALVSSNLSALMVEQSQLIKLLRRYNRMIESRKPLTYHSIEKTKHSLEEFENTIRDLDTEILDNYCNVKSSYNANITLAEKIEFKKELRRLKKKKRIQKEKEGLEEKKRITLKENKEKEENEKERKEKEEIEKKKKEEKEKHKQHKPYFSIQQESDFLHDDTSSSCISNVINNENTDEHTMIV